MDILATLFPSAFPALALSHFVALLSPGPDFFLLVGYAIRIDSWQTWLAPLAFVAYVTRFQIIPEERLLLAKFGEPYALYTRTVRRWL